VAVRSRTPRVGTAEEVDLRYRARDRARRRQVLEASRSLPFPFTLAARAENFVRGNPNLDDTIKV